MCVGLRRRLWSPNHFLEKVKFYSISYDALTDAEKGMKDNLLSFLDVEIHCQDIVGARSAKERKELFGIHYIHAIFVVCELVLPLIC